MARYFYVREIRCAGFGIRPLQRSRNLKATCRNNGEAGLKAEVCFSMLKRHADAKQADMSGLSEEPEQDSGRNRRADDACDVGGHGVHQQMVFRVRLKSHHLGNPG